MDEDELSFTEGDDEVFSDDAILDNDEDLNESGDESMSTPSDDFGPVSIKPQRKAHEIPFTVKSVEMLRKEQSEQIKQVSNILGIRTQDAASLLRHYRWNKERLLELYMEDADKVICNAGVPKARTEPPSTRKRKHFTCFICCDDGDLETFSLSCGHTYCVGCYRHYISQKVVEEGESRSILCPGDGCNLTINQEVVRLLTSDTTFAKYLALADRSYVDDNDNLRWCPAPDCTYTIDCPVSTSQLESVVPSVTCNCGERFCFGCGLVEHQPCLCALVKKWLKKCKDDSETANWISANTKECPKCSATIEKNGGCNHMTCKKCRYDFCWVCMGPWSEHGTSYYNCNRFDEKSGSEARDAQTQSRVSLERYLHYYNRYANHEQSAKLDRELHTRIEKKMTQMQITSDLSWVEVQFLKTAVDTLVQCRHTLKWTYAFAFYLARNNMTDIFEDNQKDLEMAVEVLSELCERPIEVQDIGKLKQNVLDKTVYVKSRWAILLEDTALGMQDDRWKLNTSL